MAQIWFNDNDDDDPEFDESRAGPEYWMHKRKRAQRTLSRCLKCSMLQMLRVDNIGAYAVCLNKRCRYSEVIVEWKV